MELLVHGEARQDEEDGPPSALDDQQEDVIQHPVARPTTVRNRAAQAPVAWMTPGL